MKGVKKGTRNAAKSPEARREVDKSVSYTAAEWEEIKAVLETLGVTHSRFARECVLLRIRLLKEEANKENES